MGTPHGRAGSGGGHCPAWGTPRPLSLAPRAPDSAARTARRRGTGRHTRAHAASACEGAGPGTTQHLSPVTGLAPRAPVRPGRRALWGFLLRLRPNRLPWHRMPDSAHPLAWGWTRSLLPHAVAAAAPPWVWGAGISQILIRFFRTIPRRACWVTRWFRFWVLRTLRTAVPSGRVRGPPAPRLLARVCRRLSVGGR